MKARQRLPEVAQRLESGRRASPARRENCRDSIPMLFEPERDARDFRVRIGPPQSFPKPGGGDSDVEREYGSEAEEHLVFSPVHPSRPEDGNAERKRGDSQVEAAPHDALRA